MVLALCVQRSGAGQLLRTEPYKEIVPIMTTTFEKGIEQGQRQGLQRAVRIQLDRRFGPLSEAVIARLDACPAERLEELLVQILNANSLQELGLQES